MEEWPDLEVPAWIAGEHKLLYAVLERALLDVMTDNPHATNNPSCVTKEQQAEAYAWIMDREATHDDKWSFPWICFVAGICPEKIRSRICI